MRMEDEINKETDINKMEEKWFNWKVMTAYIYLFICMFDFVVMPIYIQMDYSHTKKQIAELIEHEPNKDFVIQVMDKVPVKQWQPVTLVGGGLFHMAFGGIIGGIGITKGLERREAVRSGK
jgi:hypothetical protein